jgi:dihydroorotase
MPAEYDLVLSGGELLDPAQGLRARLDVAFKDGRVAALAPDIAGPSARETVDASGKLVVPGLIDFHGHYAYRISPFRADPDPTNLPIGVTTAVDAGTTGWINFPAFRAYVIDQAVTRLYAFIHLSSMGTFLVHAGRAMGVPLADLGDFRFARRDEAVRCIQENRDVVLGVKVRLGANGTGHENAVPALKMARDIAQETGTRVMVHVYESPLPLSEVVGHLASGDIITHAFHGDTHNILGDDGRVRPEVWSAYRNGIVFDTGCYAGHFSLPVSRAAVEQGLLPHTLSTDAVGLDHPTRSNNYDLLGIMSMFLALGMPFEDVVRSVTATPASYIGRDDLGTLRVGAVGDAAVFELEEGSFDYTDSISTSIATQRRFSPVLTVKDGKVWTPD